MVSCSVAGVMRETKAALARAVVRSSVGAFSSVFALSPFAGERRSQALLKGVQVALELEHAAQIAVALQLQNEIENEGACGVSVEIAGGVHGQAARVRFFRSLVVGCA